MILGALSHRTSETSFCQNTNAGVIYVGRIPRGFYEPQMRAYFGQFGKITHLRLSRNPKTGAPRHYGFIEFDDVEVAKIVAETMDNYLIMGHLMQVKVIPQDEVHPDLFKGSHRRFVGKSSREVEDARAQREHELHDRARTTEEQKSVNDALLKRQEKRRETLKNKGFDYDFPGCKLPHFRLAVCHEAHTNLHFLARCEQTKSLRCISGAYPTPCISRIYVVFCLISAKHDKPLVH